MIPTRNRHSLAWHDSLDDQLHRKDRSQGAVYPSIGWTIKGAPSNFYLPPSQIIDTAITSISSFKLYKVGDDVTAYDVTVAVVGISDVISKTGFEVLRIPMSAWSDGSGLFGEGDYYAELVYNGGATTKYSSVFRFCNWLSFNTGDYVTFEYSHNEDIVVPGGTEVDPYLIEYETASYEGSMTLFGTLKQPEYPFLEESTKRGGRVQRLWTSSKKVFKFETVLPEHLVDALSLIRLHDNIDVLIGNPLTAFNYPVDEFLMSVNWSDPNGFVASVEIEFTTDTVVSTSG
jgi:hypothetical protein